VLLMKSDPKKEKLEAIATPVCKAHGVEIVDVSFGREPGGAVVRVLIDRPGAGVALADCQNVSRDLSTALDVEGEDIPGPYRLEVSSPGLDRPLVKKGDFEKFAGKEIKLQTRIPVGDRRNFRGTLLGVEGEDVQLELDGKPVKIPYQDIAKANLVFKIGQ
jgi:ribosome maturation factor RimP